MKWVEMNWTLRIMAGFTILAIVMSVIAIGLILYKVIIA